MHAAEEWGRVATAMISTAVIFTAMIVFPDFENLEIEKAIHAT
jgi:hypothetical protein